MLSIVYKLMHFYEGLTFKGVVILFDYLKALFM